MSGVKTCLWFGGDSEAAVEFYISMAPETAGRHLSLETLLQNNYVHGMHSLSPAQRSIVSNLAAEMFPRTSTMPSAADIGLHQDLLDDVLRVRPDLINPLLTILDDAEVRVPSAFVSRLSVDEPARFAILMQVVGGAYYLDPVVRATIGYTGQVAIPLPDLAAPSIAFAEHTSRDRIRYRSA